MFRFCCHNRVSDSVIGWLGWGASRSFRYAAHVKIPIRMPPCGNSLWELLVVANELKEWAKMRYESCHANLSIPLLLKPATFLTTQMFIESLQRHLHVCAQVDLPNYSKRDPVFWNVISIREPFRPIPNPAGFLKFHSILCLDIVGTEGLDESELNNAPQPEHLKNAFRFADSIPNEPILVHCWAGVSRSTALALSLLVRAMHLQGLEEDEIVEQACEILLVIRPQAAPNPMVLEFGLSQFLEASSANRLMTRLVNHPPLFQNRYKGASPKT